MTVLVIPGRSAAETSREPMSQRRAHAATYGLCLRNQAIAPGYTTTLPQTPARWTTVGQRQDEEIMTTRLGPCFNRLTHLGHPSSVRFMLRGRLAARHNLRTIPTLPSAGRKEVF